MHEACGTNIQSQCTHAGPRPLTIRLLHFLASVPRSAPVRLTSKYRPGVPILVLTKSQKVAGACSMLRAAVTLVLGEQEAKMDRSGLVTLVSHS